MKYIYITLIGCLSSILVLAQDPWQRFPKNDFGGSSVKSSLTTTFKGYAYVAGQENDSIVVKRSSTARPGQWESVNFHRGSLISSMAVSNESPGYFFIVTDSIVSGANVSTVYQSTDGNNWQTISTVGMGADYISYGSQVFKGQNAQEYLYIVARDMNSETRVLRHAVGNMDPYMWEVALDITNTYQESRYNDFSDIAVYNNELYILFGGALIKSTDGTTWQVVNSAASLSYLGRFMKIGGLNDEFYLGISDSYNIGYLMQTNDFVSWQNLSTPFRQNAAFLSDTATFGYNPTGQLALGTTGKYYGVTFGGSNGLGVVFELDTVTQKIINKKPLNYNIGGHSSSGLTTASNGILYGSSTDYGYSQSGGIFGYNPMQDTIGLVYAFNYANGYNSSGKLVEANGKLYGTTSSGGDFGQGVLYSFDLATQQYTRLINFGDTLFDYGLTPMGGVTFNGDSILYGTTSNGGVDGIGTVYSFNIFNNSYQRIFDFNANSGQYPQLPPVLGNDGYLYGLTDYNSTGGQYPHIYKIDIQTGNEISSIEISSDGLYTANNMGAIPVSNLVPSGRNTFYLLNSGYGVYGIGALLEYYPQLDTLKHLISFNPYSGKNPQSMRITSDSLYFLCKAGGIDDYGTVASYKYGSQPVVASCLKGVANFSLIKEVNGNLFVGYKRNFERSNNSLGIEKHANLLSYQDFYTSSNLLRTNDNATFIESYYDEIPSGQDETLNNMVDINNFSNNYLLITKGNYSSEVFNWCTAGATPAITFLNEINACANEPLVLDAENIGSTYLWNTGDTTQQLSIHNSGQYSVVVTNPSSCFAYQETQITIYDLPEPFTLSAHSDTLCAGDSALITVSLIDSVQYKVKLDGQVDYISLSPIVNTQNTIRTIELWVKPLTPGVLLSDMAPYPCSASYNLIEIDSNGGVWFMDQYIPAKQIGKIGFNKWSHIAYRYDGNQLIGFINGQKSDTIQSGTHYNCQNGEDFYIGAGGASINNGINNYLRGYIAHTRYWEIVRTDAEIASNYKTFIDTASGLTNSLKFDEPSWHIAADRSGYGKTATLENGAIFAGVETVQPTVQPTQGTYLQDNTHFIFKPTQTTTYIVTSGNAQGCHVSDTITIYVPQITTSDTSGVSICEGQSTVLNTTNPNHPVWTPAPYLVDNGNGTATVNPPYTTIYIVNDSIMGCSATDSVTVVVNQKPHVSLGGNITLCQGTKELIDGYSSDPGFWSPTLGIEDSTATFTYLTGIVSGTYVFTATSPENCTNADTIHLTVNPLPIANVGHDTALCENSSITFNASAITTPFAWMSTDTTFIHTYDAVFTISASNNTYYFITNDPVTMCENKDTIVVTTLPVNYVDISDDTAKVCSGTHYQLTTSGQGIFNWSPAIGLNNSTLQSPTVTPNQSAWYYVSSADMNGCISSDSVFVYARSLPVIKGIVQYDSLGTPVALQKGNLILYTGDTVGALAPLRVIPFTNGTYIENNIPSGFLAVLSKADSVMYYPNIPAQYYGGSINWNNVTTINATCEDTLTLDIMHSYKDPGFFTGNATIDGYVYEGIYVGRMGNPIGRPGEPIRGIDIILEDVPGHNFQAYRTTDTTGYFNFSSVPNGNYQIAVNIPGRVQSQTNYLFDVTVSGGQVFDSTVVFYYNDTLIFIRDPQVVDTVNVDPVKVKLLEQTDNSSIELFPNPNNGLFSLKGFAKNSQPEIIKIRDVNGRILSELKNTSLATSTIVIDVRKLDLPKGVYFIEVDIKQQKTYKRFVVE